MQETSLRTPRRAPNRNASIPSALQPGLPRGGPKSRVDDRIKKRMSTRYAEMVTSPTSVEPVPPLPEFPGVDGGEGMMNLDATFAMIGDEDVRSRIGSKGVQDDKKLLEDERFDPDAFLKLKLANSTEAELKSLQSSLHNAKADTNSELQRNVFKNYAEFVLISKEITSLETEMLELKDLLSEYKYMPFLLHIPDPTIQSSNPNIISTYKRSSVADLRVMYFNQMQELHTTIEGSAKFAPTTPGRHVVAEVEGVLSLNAATYKVIGRVRFVILDDLVLVARRRRRKAGGADGSTGGGTVNEGKLVAERCWPLNEMLVLDTKDSPRMANVFKISHGKETHVYRTEAPQDKKSLLVQFRQVAEELAAKKRKEREGEHERRKSLWQTGPGAGDRSSFAAVPEWTVDLSSKGGVIPGVNSDMGGKEKAERDARWVAEWADDLTVAIALREWEKAVGLVEEGQAKQSVMPLLAQKLPPLTSLLISSLLDSLSLSSVRKSKVVSLISFLLRLKAGPAARGTFLQMRTRVLKAHMRKIKFDGNIESYAGELAVVYFTGIKHTADWFLASFRENEVASAFIDWAKGQIEAFAETFRNQVFTPGVDPKVVEGALKVTHNQSRKLLQEYGLDFRFLLDELLVDKPKETTKEDIQSIPQFNFQDPIMPTIEPVPPSRRRLPVPPTPSSTSTQPNPNLKPPVLQIDNLAPPPSASSFRSNLSPANALLSAPLPSNASGYSSTSNYSNTTPNTSVSFNLLNRENNRTPASAAGPSIRILNSVAPSQPRTPASASLLPARTPVSAAPSTKPPTPLSGVPPRPRTPASAAPLLTSSPFSSGANGQQLVSPVSRRARSPPVSASPLRPSARDRDGEKDADRGEGRDQFIPSSLRPGVRERGEREEEVSDRERESLIRAAKRNPALPPRSMKRPGSSSGVVRPVVPLREGMF